MPQTHQLTVTYVQGQTLATWSLNGVSCQDGDSFPAQPGDKVAFQFEGPGDIAECVLISGQMESGCRGSSPFAEGNRINLKANSTLNIKPGDGAWGFTVSFSAHNDDGTTAFYYLPDPEVIVGSHC
ncbi:hypothetical protein [Massilia sp. Root335]|uniref:hypothetical protein n=1 Tax=Massilia sp. Root335 TaxID=1736517 RepID=UPI000AF410A2|nr:hypothetical protein [Massilia sp. Root335]